MDDTLYYVTLRIVNTERTSHTSTALVITNVGVKTSADNALTIKNVPFSCTISNDILTTKTNHRRDEHYTVLLKISRHG